MYESIDNYVKRFWSEFLLARLMENVGTWWKVRFQNKKGSEIEIRESEKLISMISSCDLGFSGIEWLIQALLRLEAVRSSLRDLNFNDRGKVICLNGQFDNFICFMSNVIIITSSYYFFNKLSWTNFSHLLHSQTWK